MIDHHETTQERSVLNEGPVRAIQPSPRVAAMAIPVALHVVVG